MANFGGVLLSQSKPYEKVIASFGLGVSSPYFCQCPTVQCTEHRHTRRIVQRIRRRYGNRRTGLCMGSHRVGTKPYCRQQVHRLLSQQFGYKQQRACWLVLSSQQQHRMGTLKRRKNRYIRLQDANLLAFQGRRQGGVHHCGHLHGSRLYYLACRI